jgi:hypothetical protein
MKNENKTTGMLKSLDLKLKTLLEKDLQNFRATQSKNNQPAGKQLMAA